MNLVTHQLRSIGNLSKINKTTLLKAVLFLEKANASHVKYDTFVTSSVTFVLELP